MSDNTEIVAILANTVKVALPDKDEENGKFQTIQNISWDHEYSFKGCPGDISTRFDSLYNIFRHLTKLKLEKCEVVAQSFLDALKACPTIRTIQLKYVTLLGEFVETIVLPNLREVTLRLLTTHRYSVNMIKSLLFWAEVTDLEFDTLTSLDVNIDILLCGHRILRLNKQDGEFIRSGVQCSMSGTTIIWRSMCDYPLASLSLGSCEVQSPLIPLNLTYLNLNNTDVTSTGIELVLANMNFLQEFRYFPSAMQVIHISAFPNLLKQLSLGFVTLEYGLEQFFDTKRVFFPNLQTLSLVECSFSEQVLLDLSRIFAYARKVFVILDQYSSCISANILANIVRISNLDWLVMENFNIAGEEELKGILHNFGSSVDGEKPNLMRYLNYPLELLLEKENEKWKCNWRKYDPTLHELEYIMFDLDKFYSSFKECKKWLSA